MRAVRRDLGATLSSRRQALVARRKPVGEEHLLEPRLMLPPARKAHKHGHDIDPYEAAPGAAPVTSSRPIERALTAQDTQNRSVAQAERRERGNRYLRYLDAMVEFNGNQDMALAQVYGLQVEDAAARRIELQADVRTGLGTTDIGEQLERNDLSLTARLALYRRHAYSPVPAASLKALEAVSELEGERADVGSFESYLRTAKQQKA